MKVLVSSQPGPFVSVVPGLSAPACFTAMVTEFEPYDLDLEVAVVEGRFVCTGFEARRAPGGAAVTTEGLRRIPVATLVRLAAQKVAMRVEPGSGVATHEPMQFEDARQLAAAGPTDATLQYVAFHYQLAYALGDGPTMAVQERLGLARSTAGRWVDMARRRGFLGAAERPGKAGPGGGTDDGQR